MSDVLLAHYDVMDRPRLHYQAQVLIVNVLTMIKTYQVVKRDD